MARRSATPSPWVDVSDCAHLSVFERSDFAIFPKLEGSMDGTRVDTYQLDISGFARPQGLDVGWTSYPYPWADDLFFPKVRVVFPLNSDWATSHVTAMWLTCVPR
jgi:hypothetical protein